MSFDPYYEWLGIPPDERHSVDVAQRRILDANGQFDVRARVLRDEDHLAGDRRLGRAERAAVATGKFDVVEHQSTTRT